MLGDKIKDFSEVIELFHILDRKADKVLDEAEFATLFSGMQDTWNSRKHSIMCSVLRMGRGEEFKTAPGLLYKDIT